jgi:hypothetical protein
MHRCGEVEDDREVFQRFLRRCRLQGVHIPQQPHEKANAYENAYENADEQAYENADEDAYE